MVSEEKRREEKRREERKREEKKREEKRRKEKKREEKRRKEKKRDERRGEELLLFLFVPFFAYSFSSSLILLAHSLLYLFWAVFYLPSSSFLLFFHFYSSCFLFIVCPILLFAPIS
jgi:Flp pilus assembly protein TadB